MNKLITLQEKRPFLGVKDLCVDYEGYFKFYALAIQLSAVVYILHVSLTYRRKNTTVQ